MRIKVYIDNVEVLLFAHKIKFFTFYLWQMTRKIPLQRENKRKHRTGKNDEGRLARLINYCIRWQMGAK